jgi:hypothetical protein
MRLARWDLRADRIRILAKGGRIGPVVAALGFYFVALSRDGRRLTVGGYPGIALLGAATGRVLANAQTDRSLQGLAISRDGCTACSDPAELLAIARTRVTRELTADERQTFLV